MTAAPTAGALNGLRVLDLSRVVAGPLCASLLGDLGADVIKVEGPRNPDESRSWFPPDVEQISVYFATVNRSKRAITVDLASEAGRDIIRNLVRVSDVVIENFTTGTLARMGLDYESLSQINPRIVLCSITGFGQSGPYRHLPGYDFVAQAMSGFVSQNGAPGEEATKAPIALADMLTGLHAMISVLAALQSRAVTGVGQHCDLSLLDSMTFSLLNLGTTFLNTGATPPRYGNQHQTLVPYQPFSTADQDVVIAVGNNAQFGQLCTLLGIPELTTDPRYAEVTARILNRDSLVPIVQRVVLGWNAADLIRELRAHRVPCGPVNTVAQLFDDPHVRARGAVQTVAHPTAGALHLLAAPFGLLGTPTEVSHAPPLFSEHTDEVLTELGYSAERRAVLREQGVVAPPTPARFPAPPSSSTDV
ncbi:CaiB/BaiF CoA transferase family protein [Leucobacter sp. M11]|uniref:CaiB/BaiF CoA transferase family protein n=1 Tax=Leucobacter sp. M11 TaxID=2993565 RepID=UPI002D7E3483|nr:CoA transferase [Leucobacter sp. M11]MEB4615646.1 CoA transferase [Leucobacter sp. M11]